MGAEADDLAQRRAVRAERARQRRAAAGATPREASGAATLRALGINPNTHYSRQYRRRLRDIETHSDACPVGDTTKALDIVGSIPVDLDPDAQRHVTTPPSQGLHSDLWGGTVPVPAAAGPTGDDHNLIRRVRSLPGGDDPALLASLTALIRGADAAADAWATHDPQLRAMLADARPANRTRH